MSVIKLAPDGSQPAWARYVGPDYWLSEADVAVAVTRSGVVCGAAH